jgi:uncharacterized protein YkwD
MKKTRTSRRFAVVAVVIAAVAYAAAPTSAATISARNAIEPPLVQRINDIRAAHGLRRLTVSTRLTNAATNHANSEARYAYFSHSLYTPWRAFDWTALPTWLHWYWPGPGYSTWYAGENLAWGAPDMTARSTARAWMNSPPHRANILRAGWRRIGVAAVHVNNPGGYFRGMSDVTIVTAEFGERH